MPCQGAARLSVFAILSLLTALAIAPLGARRSVLQPASPRGPADVSVSHEARAIQPGEVVLVTVETSSAATAVDGQSTAGPLHFVQSSDPLRWEALVGLDVSLTPGPHPLTIRVDFEDVTSEVEHALSVGTKDFGVRRITVPSRFARPPAAEAARIQREAQLVAAILGETSPVRHWQGRFVAPVPGPPTSSFGRVSIINGQRRSRHSGADFAAAAGTPVTAPNAGRVVLSQDLFYSGETVIIDHGLGLFSMLAHLSERRVNVGDSVEAGGEIGRSGATGRVTGPHLHWTVRLAGARVDPLSLLHVLRESP